MNEEDKIILKGDAFRNIHPKALRIDKNYIESTKDKKWEEMSEDFSKDFKVEIDLKELTEFMQYDGFKNLQSMKELSTLSESNFNKVYENFTLIFGLGLSKGEEVVLKDKTKARVISLHILISILSSFSRLRELLIPLIERKVISEDERIVEEISKRTMIKHYNQLLMNMINAVIGKNGKDSIYIRQNRNKDNSTILYTEKTREYIVISKLLVKFEVISSGMVNQFGLQRISQPKDYTTNDKKSDYIKNEGLNQSQDQLDVLNALQSFKWEISKHTNFDTMENIEIKQIKKSMKGKGFYTKNDVFVQKEFRPGRVEDMAYGEIESLKKRIELIGDKEIMFKWTFDHRIRKYPDAYKINPMGSPIEKAMIKPSISNFKGRKITDKNKQIILNGYYFGLAQELGHDKLTFSEQIKIGESFYEMGENKWILELDNENYAKIRDLIDAIVDTKNGIYPSMIVNIDASNQVLQLYAVLTHDRDTAKLCNLANGSKRADAYQELANKLNSYLNNVITRDFIFTRKHVKHVLMTAFYGKANPLDVLFKSLAEDIYKSGLTPNDYKTPDEAIIKFLGFTFGENILREALVGMIREIAPGAVKMMKRFLAINENLSREFYQWTLPGGEKPFFYAKEKGIQYVQPKAGVEKFLTFKLERKKASKADRAMPANVIQSFDGYVSNEMVKRMNGNPISLIHDSFGVHPEDLKLAMDNYKDIMVEMNNANYLEKVLEELGDINIEPIIGTLTEQDIRDSVYMLS